MVSLLDKTRHEDFKILHREKKGLRLNNLEAFEINKFIQSGTTLLNEQLDLNSSPILKVPLCITSSDSN